MEKRQAVPPAEPSLAIPPPPRPPAPSKHRVQAPPRGTRGVRLAWARRAYPGPQFLFTATLFGAPRPHCRLWSSMVSLPPRLQPGVRGVYSRPLGSLGDRLAVRWPHRRRLAQAPPGAPRFPRERAAQPPRRTDFSARGRRGSGLWLNCVLVCWEDIFFPRKLTVGWPMPVLLTVSKRVC